MHPGAPVRICKIRLARALWAVTERKQQQRKVVRRCTKRLKNQMGGREALNVLAENQSLSSYKPM